MGLLHGSFPLVKSIYRLNLQFPTPKKRGGGGKVKSMVMEHQYSIISHLLKSEGNGKQKQRSLKKRRKNFRKKIKENKKSFKKELSAENGENSREEK